MVKPLDSLNAFDITKADVTVWAVKKSGALRGAPPIFTARWVQTDAALDGALKSAIAAARAAVTDVKAYDLLAQPNDGGALSIATDQTNAPLAVKACADPSGDNRVRSAKDLSNSPFYVVKLVAGDEILLAFRKTDTSWRSKTAFGLVNAVFADDILTIDERPRFTLSNHFDFYVVADQILMLDKAAFESILNYKQAHVEDFAALQSELEFVAIFAGLNDLVAYVGSNKIQLRRASAMKAKGYYKDPGFMERLRAEATALHLNIVFGSDGKIQPTPDTCRDILQALLDHRLDSRLSRNIYDVDDAAQV